MNTCFTVAQTFGAAAANSLALAGDTGTMYVDSGTYAINIATEYHKERVGADGAAKIELLSAAISVLALAAVTVKVSFDAVERLRTTGAAAAAQADVDPKIMLVFTTVNLFVDFGMCASIVLRRTGGMARCVGVRCPSLGGCCCCCCECSSCCMPGRVPGGSAVVPVRRRGLRLTWAGKPTGRSPSQSARHRPPSTPRQKFSPLRSMPAEAAETAEEASEASADVSLGQVAALATELDVSPRHDLNVCSAFAHVLADTMRTLTVMACSLLVWVGGLDAGTTDAIGSLIVCAVIALVAIYLAFEACAQAGRLLRASGGGGGARGSGRAAAAPPTADERAEGSYVDLDGESAGDGLQRTAV